MIISTGDTQPPDPRPMATMSTGRRIARVAATLVVAIAAAIGLAAPAQAAAPGVLDVREFRIDREGEGNCRIRTAAFIQLASQAEAQIAIDNTAKSGRSGGRVDLFGADPVEDDFLGYFQRSVRLYALTTGEVFIYHDYTIRCYLLDEDDSFYDDNDEIYARVTFRTFETDGNLLSENTARSRAWNELI